MDRENLVCWESPAARSLVTAAAPGPEVERVAAICQECHRDPAPELGSVRGKADRDRDWDWGQEPGQEPGREPECQGFLVLVQGLVEGSALDLVPSEVECQELAMAQEPHPVAVARQVEAPGQGLDWAGDWEPDPGRGLDRDPDLGLDSDLVQGLGTELDWEPCQATELDWDPGQGG